MNFKKLTIIILNLLLLASVSMAQSSSAMYREALKIFKSYRYEVDYADFQMKTYEEDGHTVLQLLVIVKSGRNRFDEALLVSYAASGAAIYNTKSAIDRVSVVVKVQYKEEVSIAATADAGDVVKLYKEEMDVSEFMGRLTWH
ncbi:MAG: hypothetical protein HOD43_14050 [Candidatus Marinimicrobia bacterium]|nr:hypothetical protein [Candidatus Neomarinimicrobiota bacterium]MBT3632073.1 hypothetical protein [Candidatus Neomarinimicrobiota bacterium]MBT3824659.1 hypothetical protein [Candidatus Neomarinimicrobiota bacterium]MBT4130167.1 hypothetical protein [Candidatus Neomarinimicrobiota bacterium]MBT4296917.1 hypothetical protein [Candidatus Neomarinimicrobiota bacterium]